MGRAIPRTYGSCSCFVEGGYSRRAASRHFGVSESFLIRLMQHVARLGSALLGQQGRLPAGGKLAADFLGRVKTTETLNQRVIGSNPRDRQQRSA